MTPSGRPQKDGIYYCSKLECQREKAKVNYRARMGLADIPDAPTNCANPACAKPLPPRKMRSSDSTLGRWCNAHACRLHKQATLRRNGGGNAATLADVQDLEHVIRFLQAAVALERETCEVCGVPDAVPGYKHPDSFGATCAGNGALRIGSVTAAQSVWPNRIGTPEWLQIHIAAKMAEAEDRPQEVHPA